MSDRSPDAIVHRRSNTKRVHPVVAGAKRVSFHEDVVEPGHGRLVQIRIGEQRGAPEGQEDPPQPGETLPKRAAAAAAAVSQVVKFPPLYYVNRSHVINCQNVVLNQIRSETMKKEHYNVWDRHVDLGTNAQLINAVKRDLPINISECVYKVSPPSG